MWKRQQKFSEIQSNSVVCIQAERQKVPSTFCEFVSLDQIHLEKSLTFATNNICVTVWMNQSKIAPGEKNFQKYLIIHRLQWIAHPVFIAKRKHIINKLMTKFFMIPSHENIKKLSSHFLVSNNMAYYFKSVFYSKF